MNESISLSTIEPTCEQFRDVVLLEAFPWRAILDALGVNEAFLVAFSSLRAADLSAETITGLLAADHAALEEARVQPGYLLYWPDQKISADGKALSFCLWKNPLYAREASLLEDHKKAIVYAMENEVYAQYHIVRALLERTTSGVEMTTLS